MSELLKELEPICYKSFEMYRLLCVVSKGVEQAENFDSRDDLIDNLRELHDAISVVGKFQRDISDDIWEIFYKLESIEKSS